eukprot:m.162582 g.162582  ORF g.162582 m.162582 type:complete len:69 (+) comp18074_c0_seq2:123-329(+)
MTLQTHFRLRNRSEFLSNVWTRGYVNLDFSEAGAMTGGKLMYMDNIFACTPKYTVFGGRTTAKQKRSG